MTRSELCIYDLARGETRVVLATPSHIEAPNWTPDGAALVVNGGGLLYRIVLENPALLRIETGFATLLNNDHGISPDGRVLAISDKTETGKSCIYTLPVGGGTPVRITQQVPSWWHGWSPDGFRLTYAAVRGDVFNIYSVNVNGGSEMQITSGGGHHDGPDYTPDGQWIWFNSDQNGPMALWRVRPDGRDRQRMTADDRVNWFPHPSPCGTHVLYLSYPPGTEGHPGDLEVELRLMPAQGGAARCIVALFGGQGSINVPCWAPDATQFAFVRYRPAPQQP